MEARAPSWPKVRPAHVQTKDGDGTPTSHEGSIKPLSFCDVTLTTTHATTDPSTLRCRVSTDGNIAASHSRSFYIPSRTSQTLASTQRRRRHSSCTTRERPTVVSFAKEQGECFYDVFGALGIPMVVAFIFSAGAMFNQAYIQVYPSEYANMLMNTTNYDDGEFWLLDKTNPATVAAATTLLVFFGCLYLVLVVYMLFFRHLAIEKEPPAVRNSKSIESSSYLSTGRESTNTEVESEITVTEIAKGVFITNLGFVRDAVTGLLPCLKSRLQRPQLHPLDIAQRKSAALAKRKMKRARAIYFQFSDIDGVYHAYYSAMYDIPKLAFQTVTLVTYLRKGFPATMVAFYCAMLSFNWLISFYRFQRKTFDNALFVARIFYLFDLFFAVFAPLLILTNSYYTFRFDREVFQTKVESLPSGAYDRTAQLFADPNQIAVIRLGFSHLTLTTTSSIAIKCGLLYLSIYKWRKIIRFLIQSHHKNRRQLTEKHSVKQRKQTRHHLVFGVIVFLVFGTGTLIYTIGSLVSCKKNCEDQPHCAAISYKWYVREKGCPCLVYINRKLDPRTYNEWLYPEDVTESLTQAAIQGELKSVQIVNRALPTLPDALQKCKHLQQLILIYTETERFPDWTTELTTLEYLHIEGDFTARGLKYMPPDMFSRMHKLHYIHTGTIPMLPSYPSLAGLTELESLAIVSGHSLAVIPNLDDLESLSSLTLVENYHVARLPSLDTLTDLKRFNLLYRNVVCCNGYMTGICDPTASMCRDRFDEPETQCVNDTISAAGKAIISQTQGQVCLDVPFDLADSAPTLESTDVACGGVLYRRCQRGNSTGICYNVRMQVVSCDTTGYYEKMRKLQIERSVGEPCNPAEEAWLGCQ